VAPSTPQGQLSSFSPNARNRRFMGVFAIKGPRKFVGWALRKHLSQTQEFHRQRFYQRNRLEEDGTCRRVCEERGWRADVSNRQMNKAQPNKAARIGRLFFLRISTDSTVLRGRIIFIVNTG